MFEVWPRSKVWSRSLTSVRSLSEVCHKSENCPKSVWSGVHDSDHHWSAVLLILITYRPSIMYLLSSVTSVRCLTMKATIRRLKYVRSLQSEVWKLMSKVHNRKSDVRSLTKSEVWCPMSVRKLSELCPKSEVLPMSVQNLDSKNQSLKSKVCPKSESEVCQLSKSETEVQSLTAKIQSLKVWNRKSIWSPFKVFCNYYNFVIQYQYYILCVCRSIMTIAGHMYR